jgi:E3 ubiquitin-protein ligase BAH
VEVPLRFDSEFFGLLQGEVSTLDNIQAGEHISITKDIKILSNDVSKIVNPYKSSKTDLARWREIFDVYLQAGIFFSTNELDHGSRTSMVARKQLQWFEQEVTKRGVAKSFKLSASRGALQRFLAINMTLLQNLKFQEINQLAISKILKSMLGLF